MQTLTPLNAVNEITAQYFADHFEPRQILTMSVEELAELPGMDERTANIVHSALHYKLPAEERKQIKSSQDGYDVLHPKLGYLDHEEFWIIALNQANRVIKLFPVSTGGVSGTVVDARIIASKLVTLKASACMLGHNHPSGQLFPSDADRSITKKLKKGLGFLEIKVLDHLIIADTGYYSFSDEGVI